MSSLPDDFDWVRYLELNPDVKNNAHFNSEAGAIRHWEKYGEKENRAYTGLPNKVSIAKISEPIMDKLILSNSCVGSLLYKYPKVPYITPLVGSLFLDDFMYIKFLENYDYYISLTPEIIENYDKNIRLKSHKDVLGNYVLMKLDDIEIHWIHERSAADVTEKWNRRLNRISNNDKISIWTSSEFTQIHDDNERKELIDRFCNLPEYTIFLTERKSEETYDKNYAIIPVPEWENKSQNDRYEWGFLKWNNQKTQAIVILKFLNIKYEPF